MPDYKAMYFYLFNKITDIIEILKKAQQETENMYIDNEIEKINKEIVESINIDKDII